MKIPKATIREARTLGAIDFLPKPFAREQLHQVLIRTNVVWG
jgi:hypothetical protein